MDKSKERAFEIIDLYLHRLVNDFGSQLQSVILVGSLSNGSYTGKKGSDIDIITVLNNNTHLCRQDIIKLIDAIEHVTNKDLQISRSVYLYNDLFKPYKDDFQLDFDNKCYLEITSEIFRLKESGIILYGEDIIQKVDTPNRDDVIKFSSLSRQFDNIIEKTHPQILKTKENPPLNILAQIVIVNAFRHYYFATGMSCSNKSLIANAMKESVANYEYQRLLYLSVKYRNDRDTMPEEEQEQMHEIYTNYYQSLKNKSVDFVPLLRA